MRWRLIAIVIFVFKIVRVSIVVACVASRIRSIVRVWLFLVEHLRRLVLLGLIVVVLIVGSPVKLVFLGVPIINASFRFVECRLPLDISILISSWGSCALRHSLEVYLITVVIVLRSVVVVRGILRKVYIRLLTATWPIGLLRVLSSTVVHVVSLIVLIGLMLFASLVFTASTTCTWTIDRLLDVHRLLYTLLLLEHWVSAHSLLVNRVSASPIRSLLAWGVVID